MSSSLFKTVTDQLFAYKSYIFNKYKQDLVFNNLYVLIYKKNNQPNNE